MMTTLATVAAAYVALLLLRAALARSEARRLPPVETEPPAPDTLTLAQAILSGDPQLPHRLEQNITAFPDQNLLWLVDEDDAEAQRITVQLQAAHPHAQLRIERCAPCPPDANPKVWKLQTAARLVRTPFLCVLDDDTTLSHASAATLVAAARQHTVATGLPGCLDSGNIPSALLSQFINNNSAFTYLGTARLLGALTLNGMGYVLNRDQLAPLGHFSPLLHDLTDDLALAILVHDCGGTIHQSRAPLQVNVSVSTVSHYIALMHRWHVFTLMLLKRQPTGTRLIIAALHGLPPLLLTALLALAAWSAAPAALVLAATVLALRAWVISRTTRTLFGPGHHRPLLSVVSELAQPLHLAHALVSRTIRWRSRRFRVRNLREFSAA